MKFRNFFPITLLIFIACASGNKRDKKSEFFIIEPNSRIEKFPQTFNLKAEGIVKTNCNSNNCSPEEADAIKPDIAKSFVKDGEWQEYKELVDEVKKKKYSVLSMKGKYINGKKNGLWQEYLEKTNSSTLEKKLVKTTEGQYVDDIKEGLWTIFYESGEKLKEIIYKDGKKNGPEKKFSLKGIQTEETNYVEDIRQGGYWKKTSDSNFICQGGFDKDKKSGKWIEYNISAANPTLIKYEFNYVNDIKDGVGISYHETGNKATEGNYKQDFKVAFWKEYYPQGQIDSEGNKKAQVTEDDKSKKELDSNCPSPNVYGRSTNIGEWKKYYRSGELFSIGSYDDKGLPTKEWKFYYKGNRLRAKGTMGNSIMMQNGEIFDKEGNLEGKGNMMLSMFSIDEEKDELKDKTIPSLPFTFYKKGKKYLEIIPPKTAKDTKEGEERKDTIAIEYDESGSKIGEGQFLFIPTQPFGGKKHGCWTEGTKKVSYMMGKVQTGMMESMSGCK